MYGGRGIVPSFSNNSSKIPSYISLTRVIPSSLISNTSAFNTPSPNEIMVPSFNLFWGLAKHSQTSNP